MKTNVYHINKCFWMTHDFNDSSTHNQACSLGCVWDPYAKQGMKANSTALLWIYWAFYHTLPIIRQIFSVAYRQKHSSKPTRSTKNNSYAITLWNFINSNSILHFKLRTISSVISIALFVCHYFHSTTFTSKKSKLNLNPEHSCSNMFVSVFNEENSPCLIYLTIIRHKITIYDRVKRNRVKLINVKLIEEY